MKQLRNRNLVIVLLGLFGAVLLLSPHHAHALTIDGGPQPSQNQAPAQSTDDTAVPVPTPPIQTNTQATGTYEFVAQPGDSLTVLVRRALQLYQQSKNITLGSGAEMYTETNVTQSLGNGLLEVGQPVSVPASLLQQYIDSSQGLTPDQNDNWAHYAETASFQLDTVTPTAQPAPAQPTNPPSTTENNSKQSSTDTSQNKTAKPTSPAKATSVSTGKKPTASNYWWLIGGALLIVIYFILGGPVPKNTRQNGEKRQQ
jgi:hypothetical protein